jgi:hypothetical protein
MDWVSGITGAAAGASGMLSLIKLWNRLRPKPLGGFTTDERKYLITQVRAQGKMLHDMRQEFRNQMQDMNERLVAVEGR